MTQSWIGTAWQPPTPTLGWWGIESGLPALDSSASAANTTSTTHTSTVTYTHTIKATSSLLIAVACPGSYAGAYNFTVSFATASSGNVAVYGGYEAINNADANGPLFYATAINVSAGEYTVTATITGATTDTVTAVHAASVAFTNTTAPELAPVFTGNTYYWWNTNIASQDYTDATNINTPGICLSALYATNTVTSNTGTRYTDTNTTTTGSPSLSLWGQPAAGGTITFDAVFGAACNYIEISQGIIT